MMNKAKALALVLICILIWFGSLAFYVFFTNWQIKKIPAPLDEESIKQIAYECVDEVRSGEVERNYWSGEFAPRKEVAIGGLVFKPDPTQPVIFENKEKHLARVDHSFWEKWDRIEIRVLGEIE